MLKLAACVALVAGLVVPSTGRGSEAATDDVWSQPMELTEPTLAVAPRGPVQVGVYGNVDVRLFDQGDDQVLAFGVATLDVFFASTLWERFYAFADIQFEEDANEIRVNVDRYLARFEASQLLQVAVGQLHNPIIQWNCRASHGSYLLTPITRPKVLDREVDEGVWPTHLVGLAVEGELFESGLGYFAALANGRGQTLTTIQVGEDANRAKAMVANLNYRPFADGRLRLDLTAYLDRIPLPPTALRVPGDEPLDELDVAGSLQLETSHFELRSEVSQIRIRGGRTRDRAEAWGGYVLGAYKFVTAQGEVRPYAMAAYVGGDAAFTKLSFFRPAEVTRREIEYVVGVRWEPLVGVALKLEAGQTLFEDERENQALAQIAFGY